MRRPHQTALRFIAGALSLLAIHCLAAEVDPAGFVHFAPDEIQWKPTPSIPAGGESAVLYGNPGKRGLFVTRVKLPADYRIEPHTHPEERLYTVISGTFYIGFGDKFDPDRLHAFPAGSVFVVPANASHFHWTRSGDAVVQITGVGPSGIQYVDPADDPRR